MFDKIKRGEIKCKLYLKDKLISCNRNTEYILYSSIPITRLQINYKSKVRR